MLIARVTLQPDHQPTGNTKHFIGGRAMPRPHELQIESQQTQTGFYLIYCGIDGQPMTDTFHLSLEDAFEQALSEFGVRRAEWMLAS